MTVRAIANVAATLLLGLSFLHAEIIDRIAVSVGHQVITTSDLDREIRVNAFLQGVNPDFGPENKRKTAAQMVEQRLVRRELELVRYPTPEPSEAEPVLAKFRAEHYPHDDGYSRALAEYGVTEHELKDHILWQLTLLRFVEVRFRPAVQVSEEDIRNYFNEVIKPTVPSATLEDFYQQIEQTLINQRVDKEMDAWLEQSRSRSAIEYRPEVFPQ
jgi:hypothetical protein